MRATALGTVMLFVFASGLRAEDAVKPPKPEERRTADLFFIGGSLSELLTLMETAFGERPNVVAAQEAYEVVLPPIRLNQVNADEVMAALSCLKMFGNDYLQMTRTGQIWVIRHESRKPRVKAVRHTVVKTYDLSFLGKEASLSALEELVESAISLTDGGGRVRVDEKWRIMTLSGSVTVIQAVTDLVQQLKGRQADKEAADKAQEDAKELSGLREAKQRWTVRLTEMERLLEREMSRREALMAKVEKAEKLSEELASRVRALSAENARLEAKLQALEKR